MTFSKHREHPELSPSLSFLKQTQRMNNLSTLIALGMLGLSLWLPASANELEFEAAYVVDGIDDLQPSGLAVCQNKLVFVSDKHESQLFELSLTNDGIARALPWKTLTDIPAPPTQAFSLGTSAKRFFETLLGLSRGADWEGIACNAQGDIFLASEYYFSVLKISSDASMQWMIKDLYRTGLKAGLFQKNNAYLEGITVFDRGLLLAAERDPRGLIHVKDNTLSISVQPGAQSTPEGLSLDFTGLETFQGKTLVLERNQYQVCTLNAHDIPENCYSFKDTALSASWGYATGPYGLAEGLAVDGDTLWIIVDNNGDARLSDPQDHRSTLMRFRNPF